MAIRVGLSQIKSLTRHFGLTESIKASQACKSLWTLREELVSDAKMADFGLQLDGELLEDSCLLVGLPGGRCFARPSGQYVGCHGQLPG